MYQHSQRAPFPPVSSSTMLLPPGMAGEIAKHICNTALNPMTECAIAAALGLIAGISGKAFQIRQCGLDVRFIFVAQSDLTEEVLISSISKFVRAVATSFPPITEFVDFNNYSNGAELAKAIALRPSFLNVVDDICLNLGGMTVSKNSRMVSLRQAMENPDKSPCSGYSLIGQTTPGNLRKTLTASVLETDFLHSFMMLEYSGGPLPKIGLLEHVIPEGLHDHIVNLCKVAMCNLTCHHRTSVEVDVNASLFLNTFDKSCDSLINASNKDVLRRMWDKAHEKALRVAALLAVANNCRLPIINLQHVQWARDFVLHGIGVVSRHNGTARKR